MSVEEIRSFLGADWQSVQDGIRAYLGTDISLLNDTNATLMRNSGKQIRPLVSILVARACAPGSGGAGEDAVRYAVASELLHNATLLHDDVADNSDVRRGRPTLRKLMGPDVSVLVGDFWLVRAVKAILDSGQGHERVVDIFAGTLSDLAEGEMLQLEKAASCDTTFEDYLKIIYRKTASLFVASCRSAAISSGASGEMENAVAEYGKYIGYVFQMRDDIFDYTAPAGMGKPAGVDIMEHKITLPLLAAFNNAGAAQEERMRAMVREVTERKRDEILEFVNEKSGLDAAQTILEEYASLAVKALSALPHSREKEMLCCLAGYMARRES